MPLDGEIRVLQGREESGLWRVEYCDGDGGCYVTIFAGPAAELRAREYYEALKGAKLKTITLA
jgi:hypothetical protein